MVALITGDVPVILPGLMGLPGGMEVVVILLIILLLFGNKLPGMARNLGRSFIEFKKGVKGSDEKKPLAADSDPQKLEDQAPEREVTS